jgi:hypothetical protein
LAHFNGVFFVFAPRQNDPLKTSLKGTLKAENSKRIWIKPQTKQSVNIQAALCPLRKDFLFFVD